MIIALVNQKGGCGKSTTSVHLAYWLSQQGSVMLIDADAQQSSSLWARKLESIDIPNKAVLDPEELFESIEAAGREYDAVVVDGPGSLSEVTKAILGASDLALIPCQPSGLDLSSSSKIMQIVKHIQKMRGGKPKAGLFLSRAIKGTLQLRDARQVLEDSQFPLLETTIYQRQCLSDPPATAFDLSEPAAKAAVEDYNALFTEVLKLG